MPFENKLLLTQQPEQFTLYCIEPDGRLVVLNEQEYESLELKYDYHTVEVTYSRPSWMDLNRIEEMSTKPTLFGMFVDESHKSRNMLRYLLRGLTGVDVTVKIDEDDTVNMKAIKNFNDLFGPEGLNPALVNKIDIELRLRCNV